MIKLREGGKNFIVINEEVTKEKKGGKEKIKEKRENGKGKYKENGKGRGRKAENIYIPFRSGLKMYL